MGLPYSCVCADGYTTGEEPNTCVLSIWFPLPAKLILKTLHIRNRYENLIIASKKFSRPSECYTIFWCYKTFIVKKSIGWRKKVPFYHFFMNFGSKNIFLKITLLSVIRCRGIDYTHSRSVKMLLWPWFKKSFWSENGHFLHSYPESGSGKRFRDSGMHAIDFPHRITLMVTRFKFSNPVWFQDFL